MNEEYAYDRACNALDEFIEYARIGRQKKENREAAEWAMHCNALDSFFTNEDDEYEEYRIA